jgi:hypothetical protein
LITQLATIGGASRILDRVLPVKLQIQPGLAPALRGHSTGVCARSIALLFAGILGIAPAASAGSIEGGSLVITTLVLTIPEVLIDSTKTFTLSGPTSVEIGPLGGVEALARVMVDPDPVASYEFSITNTTDDLLFGAFQVDFDIVPPDLGVPGMSFLAVTYDDAGAGPMGRVEHLPKVVDCAVGPGEPGVILEELRLNAEDGVSPGTTVFSVGPLPISEGGFDRLCVQLSFNHMPPGASASFSGVTRLPEPDANVMFLTALAGIGLLRAIAPRHRGHVRS